MCLTKIKHYHYISNRLASSGQPTAHQFSDIANAGYQVVINLATHESDNAVAEEESIVTGFKMVYEHLPVPFDAPSALHLRAFFKMLRDYEDKKIWVHCALNYRVSAFLYHYYRLVLNQPEVEAKKVMLPIWQPNAVWQQFLRQTQEAL